jgi:hypothetical protein
LQKLIQIGTFRHILVTKNIFHFFGDEGMARLPDDTVTRIKQEVSLRRLLESQGYQAKKQGKDYVIKCAFHEDDTPSLIITPRNNLFDCFVCGATGTVIDWVMKTQGVSFRFACEILQKDAWHSIWVGLSILCSRNHNLLVGPASAY